LTRPREAMQVSAYECISLWLIMRLTWRLCCEYLVCLKTSTAASRYACGLNHTLLARCRWVR
jgi:hypothetical protein